jgi:hypothetical protein
MLWQNDSYESMIELHTQQLNPVQALKSYSFLINFNISLK